MYHHSGRGTLCTTMSVTDTDPRPSVADNGAGPDTRADNIREARAFFETSRRRLYDMAETALDNGWGLRHLSEVSGLHRATLRRIQRGQSHRYAK